MQTIRTNMTNTASSQYTNHPFSDMCLFNGAVLGAGPGGLYRLCCGEDDAGVDIGAYFVPQESDFAHKLEKRLRYVYTSYAGAAPVAVSLNLDGARDYGPYPVNYDDTKSQQTQRAVIPREASWFAHGSVKISNINGAYFRLNHIHVEMYKKGHGLR